MKITQFNGLTNEVVDIQVTTEDLREMFGEPVEAMSFAEIEAQKQILKDAAIAKLATLGLTTEEAKLILGGSN